MYDQVIIFCSEETKASEEIQKWKESIGENVEICMIGPEKMKEVQKILNEPFLFIPVVEKAKWEYIIAGGVIAGFLAIVSGPFVLAAVGLKLAGVGSVGNAILGLFGGSVGSGLAGFFGEKRDMSSLIQTKILGLYRELEKDADIELIKDFLDNHLKLTEYMDDYVEVSEFTKLIDRTHELKTPAVLLFSDVKKDLETETS